MLKKMSIRNYVIIDQLDIEWPDGLIAITGETGAGKSIMIGALQFVLGARADGRVLRNPEEKCIVEVSFEELGPLRHEIEKILEEPISDQVILRREILPGGKSRTFINDSPALVQSLNQISPLLIGIHQQFDQLDLLEDSKQFEFLDNYCGIRSKVEEYKNAFRTRQSLSRKIQELEEQIRKAETEQDFIRFQFQELDAASLSGNEYRSLEEELNIASQSETILQNTQNLQHLIEGDKGILDQLLTSTQLLRNIRIDPFLDESYEKIQEIREELKEMASGLERMKDKMDFDPDRLKTMQDRHDQLSKLLKKYRVAGVDELINLRDELAGRIGSMDQFNQELKNLQQDDLALEKQLITQASEISAIRGKMSLELEQEIIALLKQLGMEFSRFEVKLSPEDRPGPYGMDKIEFLFSSNKGSELKPIKNQASGGEISRLNLAIKSIIASRTMLPTLIFDEIDSGVSGQIALQMGRILREISDHHQVITITHSAQIASRAQHHFFVFKDSAGDHTLTRLRQLDKKERISEIAKMLSGDPPTETALNNAKELISLN
jgi:DNA repair protein RecN (Recombination protein N)